jgi:TolB-like protein/class 3 adenylate cyclase/Tfp pilus assembly protein PilF
MSIGTKKEIQLEIAHVLFIDIVGYSKLSINDQHAAVEELNQVVRASEQFQRAETANRLLKISTGDGMALVFYTSPEAPAQCAVEISPLLKEHPRLQLRMGIHSGPVSGVVDVNKRANLAGAGINMAKRVMDCGDAGHILLSKRVAEDFEQYDKWRPLLHDLGSCEVKHGVRVSVVNLYGDQFGNAKLPWKFETAQKRRARVRWAEVAIALLVLAAIIAGFVFFMRRPTSSAMAIGEKSIAVLPFENLSDEKQNEYFADGVQDEILTDLAKIADLKVISRGSVMQYKSGVARNLREIGQQLGVAHLLEGSVQRAANKIRVNAQLIDARTDAHLWAQTYDRDLADMFAIQSEIATAIADQLQAKLSPNEKAAIEKPPTTDLAAFDLYTRAKTLLFSNAFNVSQEQVLRQAIELLNQAVGRDPTFFEAYYQLVFAHGVAYSVVGDHTPARLALAEGALRAVTRLRPDAGETHLARGGYAYYCLRDYGGALAELEVARRSLPNDPRIFELTGYILRRLGQLEEGARNLERSVELDPRNFLTLQQLALSFQALRRYPEEAAALDRALTIVPNDIGTKTERALVDFNWKAETRPLHDTIDSILAANPGAISDAADAWFDCALAERDPTAAERALVALGDDPFWSENAVILSRSFGEGLLARMMKDQARAHAAFTKARLEQEKIVQAQPDYGPSLCVLGLIDAALGRKEEALREGRRAIELVPVGKDSPAGSQMLVYFAIIAAWVGENDLALQYLAANGQSQGGVQVATYGVLKLHPLWDPLRGDPRFEKIVASLAAKKP